MKWLITWRNKPERNRYARYHLHQFHIDTVLVNLPYSGYWNSHLTHWKPDLLRWQKRISSIVINLIIFNPFYAESVLWIINLYLNFYHLAILRWQRWLNVMLVENMTPLTLYIQFHGCWCHGDARSQGISNHGIGPVLQVSALEKSNWICQKFTRRTVCL